MNKTLYIKCKDIGNNYPLTLGKEYQLRLSRSEKMYLIINDEGQESHYNTYRFSEPYYRISDVEVKDWITDNMHRTEQVLEIRKEIVYTKSYSIGIHISYLRYATKEEIAQAKSLQDPREVVFVTNDGVNIYNKDKYFIIQENNIIVENTCYTGIGCGQNAKYKYFSTRKAAEQYITNQSKIKTMDTNFSVTGSKYAMEGFMKELIANNIKPYGGNTVNSVLEGRFGYISPINNSTFGENGVQKGNVYHLPLEWNYALEAFKKACQPISRTFYIGENKTEVKVDPKGIWVEGIDLAVYITSMSNHILNLGTIGMNKNWPIKIQTLSIGCCKEITPAQIQEIIFYYNSIKQ